MKIFNLAYAEILKQVKKTSFKVCVLILLALAIGLPILFKVFQNSSSVSGVFTEDDLKYYDSEVIKNPKTEQDKITNDLNKTMIEVIKQSFKLEKGKKSTDFKIDLYDEYSKSKMTVIAITYMMNNSKVDYQLLDENFGLNTNNYKDLDQNTLSALKERYIKKVSNTEKIIEEDNYSYYLKKELELAKNSDEKNNDVIKTYEKLLKLNIKDSNDFRIEEGRKIIGYYNQKESIMSELEYKKTDNKISYDNYVKLTKAKNEELDKKIKKSWYAINHNIDFNKKGSKTALDESIGNNIVFLGIIIVIIAGGIVSNEFQKGTIRLLVIRPNKRWKVLLSKLLTVVVLTAGLALITYIASFITNGILYNFKDYFITDLVVKNGKVSELNYIIHSLGKMTILLIPIFFVGLLSFSLSTITKNTALSVGLSIFLLVGYSLIIMILSLINCPFINLTFLPYMDYSQFLNPMTLIDNCYAYETYYNFTYANVVLLTWGIFIYMISNLIFIKRDIKN